MPNWTIDSLKERADGIGTLTNPSHYQHPSGIETIVLSRTMTFSAGNAVKYVLRAGKKTTLDDDLRKVLWYLADCIETDDNLWLTRQHHAIWKEAFEQWAKHETNDHRHNVMSAISIANVPVAIEMALDWKRDA